MLRNTVLVFTALAALGAAAIAPTTASAKPKGGWHGGHHHHHVHRGYWGPRFAFAPVVAFGGCYVTKRWVATPFGLRLRPVRVCG